MKRTMILAALAVVLIAGGAKAQQMTVKIGVLTDMSSLYADNSGPGSVGKGTIRADGRKLHPAYLFEVKKPSESKYFGDFYKTRATIPADEAFRPLKDGGCPLVSG